MTDSIAYDRDGGVATITLNRPDALNALTVDMKLALLDALRRAGSDESVRAVVLTGAGRAFCVGQDLREHASTLAAGHADLDTVREHYNPIALAIATLPKPVVAAVNGMAAGAGASLAFACDLRVAAESAGFLMAFAKVGLGPDTGASWTLQRLVGYGRAVELLMLAEPVSAPRALEIGLVNQVVPDAEVASVAAALAGRLADGPTTAYATIKRVMAAASTSTLPEALEAEAVGQSECGHTADHKAATEAFLARQPVTFTGR